MILLNTEKNTKIAIYFDRLGANQAVYEAVFSANNLLSSNRNVDILLYYSNMSMPYLQPNFGTFHIHSAYKFNGIIIATNIRDMNQVIKLPGAYRKIFYVYDLEWHGHHAVPYEACRDAYRSNGIELWCRSEDHAIALAKAFNVEPKGIMHNFNLLELGI